MFQFSFYLANKEINENVKVDLSYFNSYYNHNGVELFKVFNLNKNIILTGNINPDLIDNLRGFKFRKRLGLIFGNKNLFIRNTHFIENNYTYYNEKLLSKDDIYLDGYWQNEKYFIKIRNIILDSFQWKKISIKNQNLAKKLKLENSISIHIRRHDKIKSIKHFFYLLKLKIFYRVASKDYYINAINYIKEKIENPKFYIFTNDHDWVTKNLPIDNSYVIVDWNAGEQSNQDMYLMTQCKHNIISISTFSWWGAWLNNNNDKVVVAPGKWAIRFVKDFGLVPKSWVKIF